MKVTKSESIAALAQALAKAQAQVMQAHRDAQNPHYRSTYATIEAVLDAIREPLAQHGIAFCQFPGTHWVEGRLHLALTTIVMHGSGEFIEGVLEIPVAKVDAQGVASATTYARRIALQAILGVAAEDDDGNGAVGTPTARLARGISPIRVAMRVAKKELSSAPPAPTRAIPSPARPAIPTPAKPTPSTPAKPTPSSTTPPTPPTPSTPAPATTPATTPSTPAAPAATPATTPASTTPPTPSTPAPTPPTSPTPAPTPSTPAPTTPPTPAPPPTPSPSPAPAARRVSEERLSPEELEARAGRLGFVSYEGQKKAVGGLWAAVTRAGASKDALKLFLLERCGVDSTYELTNTQVRDVSQYLDGVARGLHPKLPEPGGE